MSQLMKAQLKQAYIFAENLSISCKGHFMNGKA